jgi:hypothetical protein
MPAPRTLEYVFAFAVLAIAIFSAGGAASPAWWWIVFIGAALAAVVLARAWPGRAAILAEPLTARVGAFVAGHLVLPPLVLVAAIAALAAGGGTALDVAVVLAVALAVVALL